MIPERVSRDHRATSEAAQPVVEVFFTTKINTFARTTTPRESEMMPAIMFDAIRKSPFLGA